MNSPKVMSTETSRPPAEASAPEIKERGAKRLTLGATGFVLVALVLLFVWRATRSHATTASPASSALPAAVARVCREDLARELVCQAELRPWQEIDLHAKVAGYLQKINVDIGDKVEAGQLLATIEVPELTDDIERGKAALKRSEEEAAKARAVWDAAHLVFTRLAAVDKSQPNLIAQQDLDAAAEKDHSSASALAAAQAEVDVAHAELNKLQTLLHFSQITAPFSGVITRRYVDPGALIQAGTSSQSLPLVRLSQNSRLRLDIPVSVSYVSLVQPGNPVEIHIPGLEKSLSGVIARSNSKVDTATRTMIAEVDVSNPELKLIPGMYASVAVQLEHHDKALAVPVEAVSRKGSCSVLLVTKDNHLEDRLVDTGLETPHKIEILRGLTENDLVVIGNRSQFRPGQEVQPKLIEQTAMIQ
jgi:RND family efflux transporter MFP subunit